MAISAATFFALPQATPAPEPKPWGSWRSDELKEGILLNDPSDPHPYVVFGPSWGIRVGRSGLGMQDHQPLPFFDGEYDGTSEEKLLPAPNLFALDIYVNGRRLDPRNALRYRQVASTDPAGVGTEWEEVTSAGLTRVSIGTKGSRLWIGMDTERLALVTLRERTQIAWTRLGPHERVGRSGSIQITDKRWGGAGDGWPRFAGAVVGKKGLFFSRVLERAETPFQIGEPFAQIEIDGPEEDRRVVSQMLGMVTHGVPMRGPVGPFGLSHDRYHGHMFWDADVWMLPVLALVAPERARAIARFRIERAEAARENYRAWARAGAPIGPGVKKAGVDPDAPALMYPWESGPSGRETTPTKSRYQHHITASVVWGLDRAAAFGLADPAEVAGIGRQAAEFYRQRSEPGSDGLRRLRSTMSPDEFRIVDNDLYTNILAEWTMRRFGDGASFIRPRDEKSLITYDDDRFLVYKQAAAELAIYPLQDPEAERQARTVMERFAPKITANGPAMSEAIHAIIWARLGESERAYAAWRQSWEPYTRHPLLMFAENPVRGDTYFLTGAAGSLQAVLYGFAGIRIDSERDPDAASSRPLRGGKWLNVKPNLPARWQSIRVRNMRILGKGYTVLVRRTSVHWIEED